MSTGSGTVLFPSEGLLGQTSTWRGRALLKLQSGILGVATLLPRDSRKSDGHYIHDIIVSTTKPVSFPTDELAKIVEHRSPTAVIEYLATKWEFFYVSPRDYDDCAVICESDRNALETEIARAKLGAQLAGPRYSPGRPSGNSKAEGI